MKEIFAAIWGLVYRVISADISSRWRGLKSSGMPDGTNLSGKVWKIVGREVWEIIWWKEDEKGADVSFPFPSPNVGQYGEHPNPAGVSRREDLLLQPSTSEFDSRL